MRLKNFFKLLLPSQKIICIYYLYHYNRSNYLCRSIQTVFALRAKLIYYTITIIIVRYVDVPY